jgi:lipopolysaccharide transport system ATP-binding protein
MEKEVILKVENLSKQYRLGTVGTGTISHDFNRFLAKIRGKEDPYLKVGESNNRAIKGESEYVWALKDINFKVKRGEVLGIIGKNGAGKSTLLKILSKVTGPTTGSIKSNGRIASLLEVGTGFHPEMTGKENIFLNGAILGMTKKEISDKLDEIVTFSGCERYIDTPVKRYSSGMKVRLAFAVAAHLEPDILIVDEVLAVGDAEFQKKAIGKMQDISGTDGRTVLFVSHNMAAVKSLCTRGIVLEDGTVVFEGVIDKTINRYLKNNVLDLELIDIKNRSGNGLLKFDSVLVYGLKPSIKPSTGQALNFSFKLKNKKQIDSKRIRFDMRIEDDFGQKLFWVSSILKEVKISKITNNIILCLPKNPLNNGSYVATIFLSVDNEESDLIENAFSFEVEEGDYYLKGQRIPVNQSKVLIDFEIDYKKYD